MHSSSAFQCEYKVTKNNPDGQFFQALFSVGSTCTLQRYSATVLFYPIRKALNSVYIIYILQYIYNIEYNFTLLLAQFLTVAL